MIHFSFDSEHSQRWKEWTCKAEVFDHEEQGRYEAWRGRAAWWRGGAHSVRPFCARLYDKRLSYPVSSTYVRMVVSVRILNLYEHMM